MTEEQLIRDHGDRLTQVLGPDFKNDRRYPYIVDQAKSGHRTISNIISDVTTPAPQSGSGW